MKKTIVFLMIVATLFTGLKAADELSWDNDSPGGIMQNNLIAVWFTAPYDCEIITAKFYLKADANVQDPFDIWVTPRNVDGFPDENNAYGIFNYGGGEAVGDEWLSVDVSSLGVYLSSGTEFYIIYDITPADGTPKIYRDSGSSGDHNAWRSPDDIEWHFHNAHAFMIRVVVEESTSIESESLGTIKNLFN
jgi:hypothetical protein